MPEMRFYIEGPRWTRFDEWLKTYAHMKSLSVTVERSTTFLRETVRFSISGTAEELNQFRSDFEDSVNNYNEPLS